MDEIIQKLINLISKIYEYDLLIKYNKSLDKLCRMMDIEPESDNETDDLFEIIKDKLYRINYALLDNNPWEVNLCVDYLDKLIQDLS